jgi:hypothetical protein
MAELAASLLAALLGVLFDRLAAWHTVRRATETATRHAALERLLAVQHVNAKIDKEIAGESDLGAVLDRL